MSFDTTTTIVGNLAEDPTVSTLPTGGQVANLTIIANPRYYDRTANDWRDGEPIVIRSNAWGSLVENIAASLRKGTRVIATGRLKTNKYTDTKGIDRENLEMDIDAIGPDLRYARADVTKRTRN